MMSGRSRLMPFAVSALALLSGSQPGDRQSSSCSAFTTPPVYREPVNTADRATILANSNSLFIYNSVEAENDDDWNEKYVLLLQFYEQFGRAHSIEDYHRKNRSDVHALILSRWVQRQRLQMYNFPEQINRERRAKLEAVGMIKGTAKKMKKKGEARHYPVPPLFVTDPFTNRKIYASAWEQRWEDMFEKLVEFKQKYGFADCNTREGYKKDRRLADWVQIQRENLRLGMVRSDRRDKLLAVGVTTL